MAKLNGLIYSLCVLSMTIENCFSPKDIRLLVKLYPLSLIKETMSEITSMMSVRFYAEYGVETEVIDEYEDLDLLYDIEDDYEKRLYFCECPW